MPSPGWKRILLEGDVAVLSDTAPVDVDFSAASVGVGTTASRYDHKHDVPEALVGDLAAVDGDPAAIGTANKFVRADHKHALGPLAADLDFNYKEADNLSLEAKDDLTAAPTGAAIKEGRVGFYTYDDHPYVYVT